MNTASWETLATAALLGTARRPLDDLSLPGTLGEVWKHLETSGEASAPEPSSGDDDAARLLDVAALATVYRRAGVRAAAGPRLPAPADEDSRPEVGAAARIRLIGLLGAGDRELVGLWLDAATRRSLRPPPETLPALLDLAAAQPALAPVVVAATGPRGWWLAEYREHWSAAVASTVLLRDGGADDGPGADSDDRRVWETGDPLRRSGWLAALRARAPGAARDVLADGWAREAPAERAALLDVLAERLSAEDEPFLESCLGDRRADVRAVAARLLTMLPASALARRAAARGLDVLRIERHLRRTRLAVTMPVRYDAGMARDQIPPPPAQLSGAVNGPGAWLLLQVVAATPLAGWVPALGRTPGEIADLDVADGWHAVVWAGWARATVRERDAAWAAALLDHLPAASPTQPSSTRPSGAPSGPPDPGSALPELLAVLPVLVRVRVLADLLITRDVGRPNAPVAALLRTVPGPWEPPLIPAVLAWLHRRTRLDDPDGRAVLDLAARRLPTELADAMRALADRWPELSPSRRYAAAAAHLMTVRRDMLEELQ